MTTGPSFTSGRDEAASQMIELIQANPDAAPVSGDLVVKNLDWPGADEVAQRLQALVPAQARGDAPALQAAQGQIAQLTQMLATARTEIDALKQDSANAARRLQIEAFEAETNRIKAVRDARA